MRRGLRRSPLLPAENRAETLQPGKPVRPQHDVHAKLCVPGRNHRSQVQPLVFRPQAGRFGGFQTWRLHDRLPAHHLQADSGCRRVREKVRG